MAENKKWEYNLLLQETNTEVDKLLKLYEKNAHHARVVFMSKSYEVYSYNRTAIFEDPDSDDFDIVTFRVRHGISTTNKKYRHSKRIKTLRYREKTGFWLCAGRSIRRPIELVDSFDYNVQKIINAILNQKFSWHRCMRENHIRFGTHLTQHKVWSKKLFNLPKLLKASYNVPITPARLLHKTFNGSIHEEVVVEIREKGKFLKNIENLQPEYLIDENKIMFVDCIKMAKKLGKIVNCSWGLKRLKQEHDDWSEELTNILFVEDNKRLNIKGVFYQFAMFSHYYIIRTTRGLALEGKRQKHCVGGYAGTVNSGMSAIFHVKGYTLQLGLEFIKGESIGSNRYKMINHQFRGFGNKPAPEELVEEVNTTIKEFNERFEEHDCLTQSNYKYNGDESRTQIELSLGANEWEIFDLDKLDDNGEPQQILVDETVVHNEGIAERINDFFDEDQVVDYFNGNNDDLPF